MKNDAGEMVDLYIPRKWCVGIQLWREKRNETRMTIQERQGNETNQCALCSCQMYPATTVAWWMFSMVASRRRWLQSGFGGKESSCTEDARQKCISWDCNSYCESISVYRKSLWPC